MNKDEYEAAMGAAKEAQPTWQRMPKGHRSVEQSSPVKDKLKNTFGTQSHKIKKSK